MEKNMENNMESQVSQDKCLRWKTSVARKRRRRSSLRVCGAWALGFSSTSAEGEWGNDYSGFFIGHC